MPLVVIFLIWYFSTGRNNPKVYEKIHDKIGWIIFAGIVLSGSSGFFDGFATLLALSCVFLILGGPLWLILWAIRKSSKGKAKQKKPDYTYYQQNYSQSSDSRTGTTVTGLSRAVPKRRRIVEKFNKKYDLTLTPEEIDRIVNASYMSNCWEREIYDMSQKYDNLAEWYRGNTAWLRAYLKAFPVQTVTSDFETQRSICLDSFRQIFSEVRPDTFVNVEDCVNEINRRYVLTFDEMTFSIAHRFLADNGYEFRMPHYDVHGTKSDLDRLKDKYDKESGTDSERTKTARRGM